MGQAKRKPTNKAKSFAGIPRVVMESPNYTNLGGNAIRLLLELACQYKGNNNGDLCPAWTLMNKRGFRSKSTLNKALKELVQSELITLTRQGTKIGKVASLYALAWQPIDECRNKHLELPPNINPLRNFSLEKQRNWIR